MTKPKKDILTRIDEWFIKADQEGIEVHATSDHMLLVVKKLIPNLDIADLKRVLEIIFEYIAPIAPKGGDFMGSLGSFEARRFALRKWLIWESKKWIEDLSKEEK